MTQISETYTITWKIWQDPDSGTWVGVSDEIRQVAEGDTLTELKADIRDLTHELFDTPACSDHK
jgi:hypothetical protein